MKYTPDGNVRWTQPDGDGPGQGLLLHVHMLMDRHGSAYLAASNLSSMAVTKVRDEGSLAWTATAPGSSAVALALALGTDLQALATGGQTAQFSQSLADLSLRLFDSPDPSQVGAPLTVTLAARNKGPASAQAVSLRYALPSSVTLSSVEATQGSCSVEVSRVVCSAGSLARNAQIGVALTWVPTRAGALRHFAEISSTTEDPPPLTLTWLRPKACATAALLGWVGLLTAQAARSKAPIDKGC
jgi:hypothetical protein